MPGSSTATATTAPAATAVSAPGKVLLAGGYLVLDRAYTGLVFGLSARIGAVAQEIPTSPGVQLSEIVVHSPQFLDAEWRYGYHLAPEDGGIRVTQLRVGDKINPNHFVETTLAYVLTYIAGKTPQLPAHTFHPARLTVLADNAYYSQPHSSSSTSQQSQTPSQPFTKGNPTRFAKFPTSLRDAHKTGLGSSAALVTALTAALLTHYLGGKRTTTKPAAGGGGGQPFDLRTDGGKRVLHNLAQAAHCAAQGKVGSGFDVAAAVYGSIRYRRFSPAVLERLPEAGAPGFAPALAACVDDEVSEDKTSPSPPSSWDTEALAASNSEAGPRMPAGVALRMCDVDCGSQTVGMVKQVLAWRAREPAAARTLWDDLQAANEALGAALRDESPDPEQIKARVAAVRALVRAMGEASGVPIEPPSQTALLDALTAQVDGVYGGVVPGAGGFDALALLVRDDAATEARVRAFLERWSREGEEGRGVVRLLDVKGEMEGVRMEELGQYAGWLY
ncbi:phosphomevalonate kinase [Diatrype stigma]|uniref:Phosphomevalonate kinase n=1 Tax=Diatrype stigma TaxID=117547 RepID=A0AAN9V0Q0_9PEZI